MKQVEKWRWRTRWAGRMVAGKVHYTEDEIRALHPEAVRIPNTRIIVDVPETEEERQAIFDSLRRPSRDFRP